MLTNDREAPAIQSPYGDWNNGLWPVDFGTPNQRSTLRRGGRRPRQIGRGDAAVSCPGGRWGRRRTRVTECWAVLRAEDAYTALLTGGARLSPGYRADLEATVGERTFRYFVELRPNAVWRFGRLFMRCPSCSRWRTRLYVPTKDASLMCRSCWGLTYTSRTLQNYKNSPVGRGQFARMFGTSQRDWALLATYEKRRERLEASRERWAERRRYQAIGPAPG